MCNETQCSDKDSLASITAASVPVRSQAYRAYLTVAELCEELGITPRTAYRLLAGGEIPHVRAGRSIRIYRDTLEEWRRGQEEASKKKGPAPGKVEALDPSKGSTHAILQV